MKCSCSQEQWESVLPRDSRLDQEVFNQIQFATEVLMQVLADEYKNKPLRFNCINPGATRTAMRAKAFPAEDAETLKTPADIMPLYLYLMGSDSQEVNGQSLDCQPK